MLVGLLTLTLLSITQCNPKTAPNDNPFEPEIRSFEAEDAKHPGAPGGIVFVGSSSIARWKTLAQDFPNHYVLNRGFGGSAVSDSVFFADRIVTPYKPKMVVFFAGTNDIASGKSAEIVLQDYTAFVRKVHVKVPSTIIAFISVSPAPSRWALVDEFKKANALIKKFASTDKRLKFIDTFSKMLNRDGRPRAELFVEDQLHLSPLGYKLWRREIEKVLPRVKRACCPGA